MVFGAAALGENKVVNIVNNDGNKTDVQAQNIVIATGARSRILNGFTPDGKQIITSKEAMVIEKLPKSMIIVGSGAIGMEFASFFNALGTVVTVLEVQNRILPVEDAEISIMAQKIF